MDGNAKLANAVSLLFALEEISNRADSKLERLFAELPLETVTSIWETFIDATLFILKTLLVFALMVLSKLKCMVKDPSSISLEGTMGMEGIITCMSGTFTSNPGRKLCANLLQHMDKMAIIATVNVMLSFFIVLI